MERARKIAVSFAVALGLGAGTFGACSDASEEGGPLDASIAGDGDGDGDSDSGAGDGDGDDRTGDGDDSGGDGDGDGDAMMSGGDPEAGRLAGITRFHNEARARVAANPKLMPLTWAPEIAKVAQAYADKLAKSCSTTLVHSERGDRNNWGENIAWFGAFGGSPAGNPAETTVAMWEGEKVCYTLGPIGDDNTCSAACAKSSCGHFTQVAWRSTTRVGCGVADCASGAGKGSYWVCNYDPAGNFVGMKPY